MRAHIEKVGQLEFMFLDWGSMRNLHVKATGMRNSALLYILAWSGKYYRTFQVRLGTNLPKYSFHIILQQDPRNHMMTCGTICRKIISLHLIWPTCSVVLVVRGLTKSTFSVMYSRDANWTSCFSCVNWHLMFSYYMHNGSDRIKIFFIRFYNHVR